MTISLYSLQGSLGGLNWCQFSCRVPTSTADGHLCRYCQEASSRYLPSLSGAIVCRVCLPAPSTSRTTWALFRSTPKREIPFSVPPGRPLNSCTLLSSLQGTQYGIFYLDTQERPCYGINGRKPRNNVKCGGDCLSEKQKAICKAHSPLITD